MNKYFKFCLDLDKAGVQKHATEIIKNVTDGIDDPLDFYISIKKLEAVLKIAKEVIHQKAFRDTVIDDPEGDMYRGCKVEKVTSGTSYKWDDVIDPEYWKAKNALKEKENWLKCLKSTAMMQPEERAKYIEENNLKIGEEVDEETGEIIELIITPVVKEQGSSLKITIK